METKLNFKEIVPANDILEDEMEFVKGGTDLNLCLKGCITGEKSDKSKGGTTTQALTLAWTAMPLLPLQTERCTNAGQISASRNVLLEALRPA